ncbi:TM2 domain-containing membrane protein YozV [Lewinella aquimaris]|uniref:TM2 domain-containing membrane protein YozV n=1 Tax=Neolewinella aquimaris TaxID=1835722 RepID=A0A840EG31_9BACT|nr:NINE protein [Neolewinella aquimaris]MBB4079876.1 TM2 domain-containing membrane protein YozV [Neolewinella aquimaris]
MKNKTTAAILALFFGGFGVHRFYLGQPGKGFLYLIFIWTFIPSIIAMIDGIVFLTQSEEAFNLKYNRDYVMRQTYQQPPQIVINNHVGQPQSAPAPRQEEAVPENKVPKKDPFQLSADKAYEEYDFEGAIRDYRRSLNVDPRQADVHFKLACLYSIHENTDTALFHLNKAIENGYYDFDEMDRHDHLSFLRSTPQFFAFKSNSYRLPGEPAPEATATVPPEETLELSDDLITRIERLAQLKEDGILSEDAFKREKAKILRS